MLNKIIIMGRLCADPELRQTPSGVSCCRFRMAVDQDYADKQTGERKTDFINCTAWRNTAEFISRYFQKGSMIIAEGSLHNNDYTDQNGVKHYSMNVQADKVYFGESKSASQNSQNGAQQPQAQYTANYAPPQQARPQQPQNTPATHTYQQDVQQPQQMQQIGDLGDFEEILSDGDVPF